MPTESQAAFEARAKFLGLSDARVQSLAAAGVTSYGKYAFVCQYSPNGADEKPLLDALKSIYEGTDPLTVGETSTLRRLYFEAHTVTVQELRSKLESRPEDTPRQLPMAERVDRLTLFKDARNHLIMDLSLEPSHRLVDLVCNQADTQTVSCVEVAQCTSRDSEIVHRNKRKCFVSDR